MGSIAFQAYVLQRKKLEAILWLALMCTPVIGFAVAFFVIGGAHRLVEVDFLTIALAMAAVMDCVAAFVIPALFGDKRIAQIMSQPATPTAFMNTPAGQTARTQFEAMTDVEKRVTAVVLAAQSPKIVGYAMANSVGLFGLVLAFIHKDALQAVPFVVVSLVVQFLQRPDTDALVARALRLAPPGL